ncbi:hypothetical protein BDQ94DRAFT_186152 [Aspergillus welwitschiae]|uniref:Uncharacterized protein n=1 Tax=Aspergillus welwitschiae TaxID=1341132 RepID=A0A3F3PJ10_9EURO|nr:hypothetical protein BDQ94DRAFT_186152 [Aspergillus welwitschiae]RDH26783.1 hypothetical protein BDQ94DRAFT_186152 [Aspergillus welwitschiae]
MITTGVCYQGNSTHRKAFKGPSEPRSSLATFTSAGDFFQLVSTMGENNTTCEKLSSSVPKGTCCQTAVKSALSIGSPSFLLDPHQLASTLQAKCGSMVMTHACEGELKARAHLLMLGPHAAFRNMDSENLLADFHPKTPPNSPRMAASEAVPIEQVFILES